MKPRLSVGDPLLLLPQARESESVAAGADERVLARLRASLAAGVAPQAPAASDESSDDGAPLVASGGSAPGAALLRIGARWPIVSSAAFFVGGALGVAAGVAWEHRHERPVPAPQADVAPALRLAAAPAVPAPLVDEAPSPAAAPSVAAPAPRRDASSLAREQRLLDQARALMAADEPARALTVLQRHAQAYPQGKLSEEREAMAVSALAGAGRGAEARARGQRFRKQYPGSLMLPSVDAALAAIGGD